jgi:hypothetical protein
VSTLPKEPDDELREWMADWQAEPEPAPEVRDAIRRRVKRQSLKMALATAGEMLFALAMLAFVIVSAYARPTALNIVAMGGLALLILWSMGYSLWSLRGTWRPSAETTAAFLALSILRCHRRLRTLRAGWWLLALELAIMIPWLYLGLNSDSSRSPAAGDYAVAAGALVYLTGIVVAFLIGGERKVRRERAELEEMRRGLGGGE